MKSKQKLNRSQQNNRVREHFSIKKFRRKEQAPGDTDQEQSVMYKGEKNKNKKEKVMFFKPIEESMSVSSEQSAGLNAAESQLK